MLKEHPEYIFRHDARPEVVHDLADVIVDKDVMVIGKRKPKLNSKVDGAKLQKYEEQFKAYQEKYIN